jgi:hypothetical protein
MYHIVPTSINKMLRQVVINHPNAWGGFVLEKVMTPKSPDELGGLGILSEEDDDEYDFKLKGECYAIIVNDGSQQSLMNDSINQADYDPQEFRFLIEPEPEPESAEYFTIKRGDILFLVLGTDIQASPKPAYEITDIETVNNIPPFSTRYIAQRRADLDQGL